MGRKPLLSSDRLIGGGALAALGIAALGSRMMRATLLSNVAWSGNSKVSLSFRKVGRPSAVCMFTTTSGMV